MHCSQETLFDFPKQSDFFLSREKLHKKMNAVHGFHNRGIVYCVCILEKIFAI